MKKDAAGWRAYRKRKKAESLPSTAPQPATILEAAREIATPAAFRLWCVLAVIPQRKLEDGERELGRFLGVFRPHLRRMLQSLEDAGYVRLDYPPVAGAARPPGRVVLLRPPLLVGVDQFVKLGRTGGAPGAFGERKEMEELRRRVALTKPRRVIVGAREGSS